jgi:hypothetical protein
MPPLIRTLLVAAALTVPAWASTRSLAGPPAPAAGQVLVLDNERLLEGEVECEGDQYRVRRAGGELWLPADKVLKLCASRDEAFAFVSARANLRDPDERLRLARWCQLNGLDQQALGEAEAAVRMRPHHAESRQLLEVLKRSADLARESSAQAPRPAAPAPEPPAPAVDVSLGALTAFANRVQPVLMNTCLRCHTGGRGGSFSLTRAYDGGPLNRRATQQNLAAVLAQADLDRPELSPFLIKAVSVHGNCVQPPIRGAEAPCYQNLRSWLELVRATNPHLREILRRPQAAAPAQNPAGSAFAGGRAAPAAATAPRPAAGGSVAPVHGQVVSVPMKGDSGTTRPAERSEGAASPVAPAAVPASAGRADPAADGPADEFDPALFNGQRPPGRP